MEGLQEQQRFGTREQVAAALPELPRRACPAAGLLTLFPGPRETKGGRILSPPPQKQDTAIWECQRRCFQRPWPARV